MFTGAWVWSPLALAAFLAPLQEADRGLAEDPLRLYAIMAAIAFVPPLVYTFIIRHIERLNREPLSAIFRCFLYGAFFSVIIAVALEVAFVTHFARPYELQGFTLTQQALLVVVAAPLVEEFTKGLAVRSSKRYIFELEDGIVYGASAGLGFSATENLIYEMNTIWEQLNPGVDGQVLPVDYEFLAVGVLRSFTSSFLHATASGILGYGIGKRFLDRGSFIEVLPYYALAVLVHALFNALAAFVTFAGAVAAIIFLSFVAIAWTLNRIRRLDRLGAAVPYK